MTKELGVLDKEVYIRVEEIIKLNCAIYIAFSSNGRFPKIEFIREYEIC